MMNESELLQMLGMKRYRRVTLFLPYVAFQKSYYLYMFFQKSLVDFQAFLSLLFSFSVDCFIKLVEDGYVVTLFDYIRLLKLMKNSMYDMAKISQSNPVPFVQINSIRFIIEELNRRNIKGYNLKMFFDFFEENYKTYDGEKFMLSTESISKIIDRFVEYRINIQKELKNEQSM